MPTGDSFKKVRPGDKLRIPAAAYNAFIDTALDLRARQQNRTSQDTPTFRQSGIITVKNCTGQNRARFDVLGVDDPIFLPDQNEQSFKNRVMFDGVTPVDPDHKGKFVILLEPLKPNSLGMACIDGVCPVWVTWPQDNGSGDGGGAPAEPPPYADIADGDAVALSVGDAGGAQILWIDPELGPGDSGWAIVRLGAGTSTPLKWGKATEDWSPPEADTGEGGNVVIVHPCDPDGRHADPSTDVEVYLVSPHEDTGGKPLDYAAVSAGDVMAYLPFRENDMDKGVALPTVVGGTFQSPADLREHPDLFNAEEEVLWDRQAQGGSDGVIVGAAVNIHPHHRSLAVGDIDKWHTLCGSLEIDSGGHIRRIKANTAYDQFNVSEDKPQDVVLQNVDKPEGTGLEASRSDHIHKLVLAGDAQWVQVDPEHAQIQHIGPQAATTSPATLQVLLTANSDHTQTLHVQTAAFGFDAKGHYAGLGAWTDHTVTLPAVTGFPLAPDGRWLDASWANQTLVFSHIGPQAPVLQAHNVQAEITDEGHGAHTLHLQVAPWGFDATGHCTGLGDWQDLALLLPAATGFDLAPDGIWIAASWAGSTLVLDHLVPDGTTATQAKYVSGLELQGKTLLFPTAAVDFDYCGHAIEVWDETQGFPQIEFMDDDWINLQPCGYGGNYQLQFQHLGPCDEVQVVDPLDSIGVTFDSLLIRSKPISLDACGHVRTPPGPVQEHELLLQRISVLVDFQVAGNQLQVKRQNIYVPIADPPGEWETVHTGTECPTGG